MYWDIVKNYYANKQEEIGAVIHSEFETLVTSVTNIDIINPAGTNTLPASPATGAVALNAGGEYIIFVNSTGTLQPVNQIMVQIAGVGWVNLEELANIWINPVSVDQQGIYNGKYGNVDIINWRYKLPNELGYQAPLVTTFPL